MPTAASTHMSSLKKYEEIAEGTMAFHLAKPSDFLFRAGQSIDLTLINPPETDAGGNTRAFSIASAPFDPDLLIATRMRDTTFKCGRSRPAPNCASGWAMIRRSGRSSAAGTLRNWIRTKRRCSHCGTRKDRGRSRSSTARTTRNTTTQLHWRNISKPNWRTRVRTAKRGCLMTPEAKA